MKTSKLLALLLLLAGTGANAQYWSNTNSYMYNTFGTYDRVGIGTNTPERLFHVDGGSGGTGMMLGSSVITNRTSLWLNSGGTDGITRLQAWWAGVGTGVATIALNPNGGKIGIGTAAPERQLHIDGGTDGTGMMLGSSVLGSRTSLWLNSGGTDGLAKIQSWWVGVGNGGGTLALNSAGGKVGIGTSAPERLFHVDGGVDGTQMMLGSSQIGSRTSLWINSGGTNGIASLQCWWAGVGTGAGTILINPSGGNVAIGSSLNPNSHKLAVDGKIGAREINVTAANPWPDYVFHKDYKLPTLEQLQLFINDKGHLPEVPTQEEVSKNGQDLGAMNAILLKKIEELTLYVINQGNEIKELKEKVNKLEK